MPLKATKPSSDKTPNLTKQRHQNIKLSKYTNKILNIRLRHLINRNYQPAKITSEPNIIQLLCNGHRIITQSFLVQVADEISSRFNVLKSIQKQQYKQYKTVDKRLSNICQNINSPKLQKYNLDRPTL
ncbi:Hypothetical_protein [Hexamita inflata]|nr:Hypothetical protein HINF_LOCUS62356 [Hexamita inflata]